MKVLLRSSVRNMQFVPGIVRWAATTTAAAAAAAAAPLPPSAPPPPAARASVAAPGTSAPAAPSPGVEKEMQRNLHLGILHISLVVIQLILFLHES